MRSKDVLKEAIRQFDGTVILVSHDRDFLDGLVSRVYAFANGRVREHIGGIYDYIQETKPRPQTPSDVGEFRHSVSQSAKAITPSPREGNGEGALSWQEQKTQARQRKKLEKAVSDAEQNVTELEQAIAILETRLATAEGSQDMSLYEKHGRLKEQLSKAEDEWTKAMEELEALG
jgi:ATP-binding cassette subfamily F protein 3